VIKVIAICTFALLVMHSLRRPANSPDFCRSIPIFRPILRLYDFVKKTPDFRRKLGPKVFCRFPIVLYSYLAVKWRISKRHNRGTNLSELGTVLYVQNGGEFVFESAVKTDKIRSKDYNDEFKCVTKSAWHAHLLYTLSKWCEHCAYGGHPLRLCLVRLAHGSYASSWCV